MIATAIHSIQLIVHIYFMKMNFTATNLEEFWHQIKYLTNVSNLCMFLFLVPQLIEDFKFIRSPRDLTKPRYSQFTCYVYQCMNPIIFIVMALYWILNYIDPKLVFGNRDISEFDQSLMFYVHGGNWLMMQTNHFLNQPKLKSDVKALIYFFYVLAYFGIYGLHYYFFEEHVYGFQAILSKFELVSMYAVMFFIMFTIDQIYEALSKKAGRYIQVKHK